MPFRSIRPGGLSTFLLSTFSLAIVGLTAVIAFLLYWIGQTALATSALADGATPSRST